MLNFILMLFLVTILTPVQILNKNWNPHIDSVIEFDKYSSNIIFDNLPELDHIAEYINTEQGIFIDSTTTGTRKFSVVVEGSGITEALAYKRAYNVFLYLVGKGVPENKLSFAVGDLEEARAAVRFILIKEEITEEDSND